MKENQVKEVIKFINKKYDEEVPRPVKFVIRRRAKKIESLKLEDFPESVLSCTVEEFLVILKEAYKNGKLEF